MKKIILAIYYIGIFIPWLYFLVFYSYVIRATIKLGYIPSYNNPDPKELNFTTHYDLAYYTLLPITGYCVIISFIVAIIRKFKFPKWSFIVLVLGAIFIFYNVAIDPFMEWFAD